MNFNDPSQQQGEHFGHSENQPRPAPWQTIQPFPDYGVVPDPAATLNPRFQDTPWDYIRQLEERNAFLENELGVARNQLAMQSNQANFMMNVPPSTSETPYMSESQRGDEDSPEPATESSSKRRKYIRKPRPDANAPTKPLTAYATFANDMRRQYQDRNLSFSDLAKQIGQDWQNCPPHVRDSYLSTAVKEKERFETAMNQYRGTEEYRAYQEYLADFKAKAQQRKAGT